ncbi:hypothetical protein ACFSUS_17765 [Spirosoma soli]|uniref:Uncharacterized protein n=1 Tax=Spirosoma soli TaxID=1770529 RepID=A0ABW5M686_9BACT
MNSVQTRISMFYKQMEEVQSEQERLAIKQARQQYYDQLSESDQKIARKTSELFLAQLAQQIEAEIDPKLDRLDDVLAHIQAKKLTAQTTESAPRQ